METISRELLTFLLNSLWQIPLIAGVAALACRLMRNGPATHRQAVWVAALAASVLLPLGSTRRGEPTASVWIDPSTIMDAAPSSQPAAHALLPAALAAKPAPAPLTISLAETTAVLLIGAYVLFVLFRLARLALAAS